MECFLPIVRGGVFPSFRAVSAAPPLSALREVQFLELGYRGGDVSRGPSILPQTAVAVVRVVGVTVGNAAAGAAPTLAAQHPPPTGGIRLAPDEKVRGALAPVARFASVGDGLVARAFRAGALRALRRLDRLLRRLARGASSVARVALAVRGVGAGASARTPAVSVVLVIVLILAPASRAAPALLPSSGGVAALRTHAGLRHQA